MNLSIGESPARGNHGDVTLTFSIILSMGRGPGTQCPVARGGASRYSREGKDTPVAEPPCRLPVPSWPPSLATSQPNPHHPAGPAGRVPGGRSGDPSLYGARSRGSDR